MLVEVVVEEGVEVVEAIRVVIVVALRLVLQPTNGMMSSSKIAERIKCFFISTSPSDIYKSDLQSYRKVITTALADGTTMWYPGPF